MSEVMARILMAPERACGSRIGDVEQHGVDRAGQQVVDRRRGAAIGHVQQVGAGLALEQLDREMGDAAGAGGAAVHLAGIGLGMGDEALEIADAELAVDGQRLLHAHHQDLRGDVLGRVERHLGHQALHDGAGRGAHQAHDMGVGAGLGDEVDAGDAGRAALVLDQHRLAEERRHALGEVAAEDVGRPAGRERHDEGEGLAGKGLLGLGLCLDKRQGRQSADGYATRDAQVFSSRSLREVCAVTGRHSSVKRTAGLQARS